MCFFDAAIKDMLVRSQDELARMSTISERVVIIRDNERANVSRSLYLYYYYNIGTTCMIIPGMLFPILNSLDIQKICIQYTHLPIHIGLL